MTISYDKAAPTTGLPAVVAAMLEPTFYPQRPANIELKQTHISYVVIAGDLVYKIKKPVRFPFLDASSLALRRELCLEEIRLNRRLAPEIYVDVVPIVRTHGGYEISTEDPPSMVEEYAVRMRRLEDSRMLDVLVKNGKANAATMREIADRLARFHREASTDRAWHYGSAGAIWELVIGDLAKYEKFIGYTVSDSQLRQIQGFCRSFITAHWEVINQRAMQGRVREVHGDLRCEQICIDREVIIFDCLEFSERLRYCDTASEVGFLAMDLDHLEAPVLAQEWVIAYTEAVGDQALATMLAFYKCYRAAIRAMVESQTSLDQEISADRRDRAKSNAAGYFELARRYAAVSMPSLIAVCGLSGTGKSTMARALRNRLGFQIIDSDTTRKRLAGLAPSARSDSPYSGGIYSDDLNRRTYAGMLSEAATVLDSGRGAIFDATYRDSSTRAPVLDTALAHKVPALFVECQCDEKEVVRRLNERSRKNQDPSEATADHYLRQRDEFEPMTDIPKRARCVVDMSGNPTKAALAVERFLYDLRQAGG